MSRALGARSICHVNFRFARATVTCTLPSSGAGSIIMSCECPFCKGCCDMHFALLWGWEYNYVM